MRDTLNLRVGFFFTLGLTLFLALTPLANGQEKDSRIVIITHPENPITVISKSTLKAIYSMHLQEWPNGQAVKVYVLPDRNPTHQKFTKSKLGFFAYQLRRSWDRQVYSGTGDAPFTAKSIEDMKQFVSSNKGAIGYIVASEVDSNIKILQVE